MLRLLIYLVFSFIIGSGAYVYYNSQRTFEAKFRHIDGLPTGAGVTILGVRVGEVIRTRPAHDGVIVTVRITNKKVPNPEPGSELTITSFRPNRGRVLEIIPPRKEINDMTAWIVQEPITNESWLHASLDLVEGLKTISQTVIKYVTPENFEKARRGFSQASEVLNHIAINAARHEKELAGISERFSNKSDEANRLLITLQKPIASLNKIITDKNLTSSFKNNLGEFTQNLNSISEKLSDPDFVQNSKNIKEEILTNLNEINTSLTAVDKDVTDPVFKGKIKDFNNNLVKLNVFYESLNQKDIAKNTKEIIQKAKEVTTRGSEITDMLR